jgi:tetratricopeptide (TPR) repeat protein
VKNKKRNKHSISGSFIKHEHIFYLLLLILIPSALYFRVVNFDLSRFDDSSIIANINNVQGSPLNLKEAFKHDAFMSNKGDTFYRPVQTISFMLDAKLGGDKPWIYHLSNLFWHIMTVITLFFFLRITGVKDRIAFLLSLLFSINPMLSNAVAWIPARGDMLLCLFSLLAFITYLKYSDTNKSLYLLLFAITYLFAVFSKETSVLIPVLILSYVYFVQKKKLVVKEIIPILSIWFLSYCLFFIMRQGVIKTGHSSNIFGIVPFIKNLPVIPISFFKFFIPYHLCTMPLFQNIELIGGVILLVLFFGFTLKFIHKDWRIIVWSLIWFLAFTIPPMFFRAYFASIGYDYFEYRAYLPIIGILLIIGIFTNDLTASIEFKKILIIAAPILLIYSTFAFYHTSDFANPFSFFNNAIKTNYGNAMAFGERGSDYFYKNNMVKAMEDFDESIKICQTYPVTYFNKGLIYSSANDHYKAEYFFSLAMKYDTLSEDVKLLKGDTYDKLSIEKIKLRKFNEAMVVLKKGTDSYPDDSRLHNNIGLVYYNTEKFDSALIEYGRAIEAGENNYAYYDNRGMTEYHLGDLKSALNDFNAALELKPDYLDSWGNKGITKVKLNDFEGAVSDLTKVLINSKGNTGAAYYYRGIAYLKLNRIKEAKMDWKKAAESGYLKAVEMLNQY